MQVFVPLEEIPEGLMFPGALVPYQVGMRVAGRAARSAEMRVQAPPVDCPRAECAEARRELACCED
ncbi:MAG TPA: hypothetical protein VMR06_09210 [Dokdonella sp.]|uniref:hypothetical protein n=1 Tax=Dokdonella sp. TaxID=2291710 RepID=UPI002BEA066C|nr:hypothetical protein [Dokdonella sp.]HUD42156.1 hypothetical protein [Dokdonella sp.]